MAAKLTKARKAWDDACKAWSQDNLDQIEEAMRLGEVMMFAATDLVCALEDVIARANTLSDALNAYGYPVSDAAWKASSGAMSIQARGLHLAAANYREARDDALSQHQGGTDGR